MLTRRSADQANVSDGGVFNRSRRRGRARRPTNSCSRQPRTAPPRGRRVETTSATGGDVTAAVASADC